MMTSKHNSGPTHEPFPAAPPLRRRDVAVAGAFALLAAPALLGAIGALATLAPPAHAADEGATLRLKSEEAAPRTAFFHAKRKATYRFEIGGQRPRDVRVQVVRSSDRKVFRAWKRDRVEPGTVQRVRWNGGKRGGGAAPGGHYFFRVREQGGGTADRSRASDGTRRFEMRGHKFPVRGRHTYGDGFGAGRGHQGQDVFAKCGTRLVAARAGRVKHRGRQSRAGHYVVIAGRQTGRDYAYMHLKRRAKVREGERVETGQMIGRVGRTGNASGCHLHFEVWSAPGWYSGGKPKRTVTRLLRKWDSWS